jgi:L-amino acid N-acyltransferase YncA
MDERRIRDAGPADAARCAQIYAPYVLGTTVSFETEPPPPEEMARRITAAQARHAWLVLEDGDAVTGYAYAGSFMARAAYAWSTAVSVYVDETRRRTGAGRALYGALGFEPVGTYRRVGWKQGAWRDVLWQQRPLAEDDGPPQPLR